MQISPQVPVYYINLASRPDRRDFMEAQFARLGFVAHRVEAVRIDEVPPELIAFHESPDCLWRSNPGDLACGLSHERAWKAVLDAGHRAALIFEDDAVLAPTIADFLAADILERLQADLVKLETFRVRIQLGSTATSVGATTVRELCSSQMGAAAYLIGHDAIGTSLASPMLRELSVDRLLFGRGGPHLLRSRVLQAIPSPCIQLDKLDVADSIGESNIATTRTPEPERPGRDLGAVIGLHLDHVGRLARLASRDLAALRGPHVVVPFADAPGPT